MSGDEVEVAHGSGARNALHPVERSLDPEDESSPLDADSVVLMTGGARGITAHIANELARRHACTLVLVGRSPLPELQEDPELEAAADANALRRVLATRRAGSRPAEIEREVRELLAAREISSNLSALRAP